MARDEYPHATELILSTSGLVAAVPLLGPSSQPLTIPLNGSSTIGWATTDRRACDVEIRVRIAGWLLDGAPEGEPLLRWQLQTAHGLAVWDEPNRIPLGSVDGMQSIVPPVLPSRGLILRTTARDIQLKIWYEGVIANLGNPPESMTVRVSFMPVGGLEVPVYPRTDYCAPFHTGNLEDPRLKRCAFPIGATEWRLFDAYGRPFNADDVIDLHDVHIWGHCGHEPYSARPVGGAEWPDWPIYPPPHRAEFAEWQPIPVFGVDWHVGNTDADRGYAVGSGAKAVCFAGYR
jgi:hypothetical protein